MSKTLKKRTREEIILAVRESIQRKREWQARAREDFKRIRQDRLQQGI